MKLANVTRDVATGNPIVTGSTVITGPDGAPVATVAVDGVTGRWVRQQNGSPGITLAEFDAADQTRKISGDISLQSGANYTGELERMLDIVGDGAYGPSSVPLSAPGGMFVRVGTGNILIDGVLLPVYTAQDLAVAAAHATLPRIDVVVGRLTKTGTYAGRTLLAVLTGTPAASPAAPALTNDATTHEVQLGQVLLTAAASAVTGGMLSTTARDYAHLHSVGLTVTTRTAVQAHGTGFASHSVACNVGEVCTGGGMSLANSVVINAPFGGSSGGGPFWAASQPNGNGWYCQTYSDVAAGNVTCYAQCASLAVTPF